MQFVEPLKDGIKLTERLNTGNYRSVVILFGHGLGDCIMFASLLDELKILYPDIDFRLALQRGLDEEEIFPEAYLFSSVEDVLQLNYDLCAAINFPVETDPNLTKSELCCREELGMPLLTTYKRITKRYESRLCAVHFNLTCLPDLVMPDRDVAERIWNDILAAGWIPIEVHFQHIYHNPVNEKFDFIDCTVRRCVPKVATLLGLLQRCGAFVGVVSGPFHCAMATLNHNRIAYLEKEIPVARFTHEPIKTFNVKDYQGGVGQWLKTLAIE